MSVGKCCLRPFDCSRNCDHRAAWDVAQKHFSADRPPPRCCNAAATCSRAECKKRQIYLDSIDSVGTSGTVLSKHEAPYTPPEFRSPASSQPAYSDTKPAYYNAGPDDLIAFALKHDIGAIEFTIMRYVMRWKQKQPLLSLRKAREYLDRLIEHEEAKLAKDPLAEAGDGVSCGGDTGVRST